MSSLLCVVVCSCLSSSSHFPCFGDPDFVPPLFQPGTAGKQGSKMVLVKELEWRGICGAGGLVRAQA